MGREHQPLSWDRDWQDTLRKLRGMDDGLSYRMERTDTLRNAIVPQCAFVIFQRIASVMARAAAPERVA
jgi:hypothetical protein